MTTKDKLIKKYKNVSLKRIEDTASAMLVNSNLNRKIFIEILYYLDFTKRFREDETYKNESFETYINDKFSLRLKTYKSERWAFIKHGESAQVHGTGIITSIKQKCGHKNVRKVLDKIIEAQKKTKKPLSRSKKQKIIESYALPVEEKPFKESVSVIEAKLHSAENVILENDRIKTEQKDQIGKLKETVKKLKAENTELKEIIKEYRAKEKKFMNVWSPVSNFMDQEMHTEARVI